MRRGFSLLEAIIALVILLIGLVPLVNAFRTGFRSAALSREQVQAMYLAEAVLEEARGRLLTTLKPFYQLKDDPRAIRDLVASGAWKAPFETLGHARCKALASPYFDRVVGAPLTPAIDPIAHRALQPFDLEVKVTFEPDGAVIDSDGDRKPETDMCHVTARLTWAEGAEAKSFELATLFTRTDFNRALGAP